MRPCLAGTHLLPTRTISLALSLPPTAPSPTALPTEPAVATTVTATTTTMVARGHCAPEPVGMYFCRPSPILYHPDTSQPHITNQITRPPSPAAHQCQPQNEYQPQRGGVGSGGNCNRGVAAAGATTITTTGSGALRP